MKIKYVQLESVAFLTDIDFVQFTPAERGVYCSLILYLTSNDGKCTFEPDALSRIIPPLSRSDLTYFRNVTNWLLEGCISGRFNSLIFDRVLGYTNQARQGKKLAAVFMSILKEELRYEKKGKSEKVKR